MSVLACPKCETAEYVKVEPDFVGFTVHCDNCYDVDCQGDPPRFVSLGRIVHGNTEAEAIAEWNEYVEDENIVHTCSGECGWCNGNPNIKEKP